MCAMFLSASPNMFSVVHRRNRRRTMCRRRHTPLKLPLLDPATGIRPPVLSSRLPCLHEGQQHLFPPRLLLAAQSHSSLRPLRLHRTSVRRLPPSYTPVRNGRPSKSPQPPQLLRLPQPCCGSGARRRSTTMSSSPRAKLSRVRFPPPFPSDEADMLFRRSNLYRRPLLGRGGAQDAEVAAQAARGGVGQGIEEGGDLECLLPDAQRRHRPQSGRALTA